MTIQAVPKDVMLNIFSQLPPNEVATSISRVNKLFHSYTSEESLWKGFCDKYDQRFFGASANFDKLVQAVDKIINETLRSVKREIIFVVNYKNRSKYAPPDVFWLGRWMFFRELRFILQKENRSFDEIREEYSMRETGNITAFEPRHVCHEANYCENSRRIYDFFRSLTRIQ